MISHHLWKKDKLFYFLDMFGFYKEKKSVLEYKRIAQVRLENDQVTTKCELTVNWKFFILKGLLNLFWLIPIAKFLLQLWAFAQISFSNFAHSKEPGSRGGQAIKQKNKTK